MKRLTIHWCLHILFISCFILGIEEGYAQETNSDDVALFESTLGKEQSDGLTQLVQVFEQLIQKEFPYSNTKEAYLAFLMQYSLADDDKWPVLSDATNQKIEQIKTAYHLQKVTRKYPVKTIVVDSVIYNYYIGIPPFEKETDTTEVQFDIASMMKLFRKNYEEIKNDVERSKFYYPNKFTNALTKVSSKNRFIQFYLNNLKEVYKVSGQQNTFEINAYNFLRWPHDYDDYFIKRIIVMEIFLI
ncbi:hypothetical protein ACG2LH_11350 [Zhouia sp. PK063]|uniref:hypothetical protein n=1 Tax=Zhouia sp. PK063 TaxID=3373602 RepID=UPI00379F85CF